MLTIKALWGGWGVGDIMKAGNDDEGDPGKLIWSIVAVRPPSHTKFHYPRKEGRGQRGRMVIWHKVNRASIGRYDFFINLFLHSHRQLYE